MDSAAITALLDEVFDQGIVYHGFTDYMRDYEVVYYCTADPRTGVRPEHRRYRFKYCVSAEITTALSPETWQASLDDRLTSYAEGVDLPGYVWGVKWQVNYPGAALVEKSKTAARWSKDLGIPFHEVMIETNGHNIRLVFSEIVADTVGEVYTPVVLGPGGPDFKTPLL